MALNTESLTYWYFRLNGFFTIPNFVVHPDQGSNQRTEIDVLGIRFPHRAELLVNPMVDDELFTAVGNKTFVAIAEVKKTLIELNPTWRDPDKENIQRFLRAAGAFEVGRVDDIAAEIYRTGIFTADERFHVSLLGIGRWRNPELPTIPQITWDHIAEFISARFTRYRAQKQSHDQWDLAGRELWDIWQSARNHAQFLASILALPHQRER